METQETQAGETASGDKTETLVVVSKVKKVIRAQSGLNTSQCCIDALTRRIADEITKGIQNAKTAGRKTVMGRDILA
jgi:histone H3/H4